MGILKPWPKIPALGKPELADLFKEDVEVTEKIDGSQFNFDLINGELCIRSKGAVIDPENPPNLFRPVVDYVVSISKGLVNNITFHGETLSSRRHNTLCYDRVPQNYFMVFGALDKGIPEFSYENFVSWRLRSRRRGGKELSPACYSSRPRVSLHAREVRN